MTTAAPPPPTETPETPTTGQDRGVSPIAGRLGGRQGRMITLAALAAGCGVFLFATWDRGDDRDRDRATDDTPPRQLAPFEPARRAEPPILETAETDPFAPTLVDDDERIPAIEQRSSAGSTSGPTPGEQRRALADSAQRSPVLAYRPGDGFVVPAHLWKAAALSRLVARALDGRPVDQVTPEMLLGLIRDCLWSDDRPPRQRASLDALRSAVPGFRPPSEAMQAFMDDLQSEGLLLYRKGDHRLSPALIERVRSDREARRAAAAAEAARLRREMDVQAGLERLFALAERPTEDDAFSLAAWTRNSPVAPGRSLADLVMAGDADWRALLSGLSAIERMLEGGALTDELLGLPFEERLEEARRQAAWIVAQERAAQEEAERRARAGRMVAIREAAWAALNGEAEYWLSSPLAPGAACAIRTSEQSDEGLGAALGALRRHVAELEEAARKAVVIEGFQARLRQAAGASFEPARAEFFLNNRRPELGMATPLAYCVDERSLREAMSLLGSRSKR